MKQGVAKVKERYNWPVTILLIIGIVLIILLPLYMALMIAIKDPSDMNNILALPRKLRLQNFVDAWVMTNFPQKFLHCIYYSDQPVLYIDHKLLCSVCNNQKQEKEQILFRYVLLLYQCYVYPVPGNHASIGCTGKCVPSG